MPFILYPCIRSSFFPARFYCAPKPGNRTRRTEIETRQHGCHFWRFSTYVCAHFSHSRDRNGKSVTKVSLDLRIAFLFSENKCVQHNFFRPLHCEPYHNWKCRSSRGANVGSEYVSKPSSLKANFHPANGFVRPQTFKLSWVFHLIW